MCNFIPIPRKNIGRFFVHSIHSIIQFVSVTLSHNIDYSD